MGTLRERVSFLLPISDRPKLAVALILGGVLWVGAAHGQGSSFFVPDDAAAAYDGYAVVAGLDVRVGGSTQVTGDVHADEDVEISPGGSVVGDVSAGGLVPSVAGA